MALFKIYNNIDSNNPLPKTHRKGYMYFDISTNRFYIDIEDDPKDENGNFIVDANGDPIIDSEDTTERRVCLNSWIAHYALYADDDKKEGLIKDTYLKKADMHTLTFGDGTFVYNGSEDVTVPVYTGEYDQF